jgi:hypothetical protein
VSFSMVCKPYGTPWLHDGRWQTYVDSLSSCTQNC